MPRTARLSPVQIQPPQHRHSVGLPGPGARHHYIARRPGRACRAQVEKGIWRPHRIPKIGPRPDLPRSGRTARPIRRLAYSGAGESVT